MLSSVLVRTATVLVAAIIFNDILPILAQGTSSDGTGRGLPTDGFDSFVSATSVRSTWIAFWVLWLIWSLLTILSYSTRESNYSTRAGDNKHDHERGNDTRATGNFSRFGSGLKRAAKVGRDLLLGLLSALVMNTFGRGSGRSVEIIAWIYVALAVIYLIVEVITENRFIRVFYGIVEFGLLLAIFSLAYAHGWVFVQ